MILKNKKEKITLEDLAREMRGGFSETKNTIEELAIATKNGFDGVDEKFKKVDEKFKKVDEKFKKVDEKFKKVDEKLDKHDSRFTALELAIKFGFGESKEMFEKLEEKIDKNNILLDSYVNSQESFKQEFMVMKEEMVQVKKVIKDKLAVEIKAV